MKNKNHADILQVCGICDKRFETWREELNKSEVLLRQIIKHFIGDIAWKTKKT